MEMSIVLLAFCGYLGGLLVLSRTLRWAVALREVLRSPADGGMAGRPWPVVAFLHSGPWVLALAIGATWYVGSMARPHLLWALVGGFVVSALFILSFTIRRKRAEPAPLTPERLAQKRREFYLLTIGLWTVAQTAGMAWIYWPTLDRDLAIVIITALCSPLSGWLFAWVMWQMYSTSLEVAAKRRRQRAERAGRR